MIEKMEAVERIEVKRCFLLSNKGKELFRYSQKDVFLKKLDDLEKDVLVLDDQGIDREISLDSPERLEVYNELDWHHGKCPIDDMGVWNCARGLPEDWTLGSLRETALFVKQAIAQEESPAGATDAFKTIHTLMKLANIIAERRYLSVILVQGGCWRGREKCKVKKWNIDDGNMRAIALALTGRKMLNVYMGFKNKNARV